MIRVFAAGRLGRDAQHKQTQGGTDLCSFTLAADAGFGDRKQTIWLDVTSWGKGSRKLAEILHKGAAVTVVGELTTREHEGKTYLQCNADDIAIQSTNRSQSDQSGSHTDHYGGGSNYDDLSTDGIDF